MVTLIHNTFGHHSHVTFRYEDDVLEFCIRNGIDQFGIRFYCEGQEFTRRYYIRDSVAYTQLEGINRVINLHRFLPMPKAHNWKKEGF